MLIIRQAQMQHFDRLGTNRFSKRLEAELREIWPDEWAAIGEERLVGFVDAKIGRAKALGITVEFDVARFVALCFVLRRGHYHEEQWAVAILRDRTVPARIRMNLLWDEAHCQLEDQARHDLEASPL